MRSSSLLPLHALAYINATTSNEEEEGKTGFLSAERS